MCLTLASFSSALVRHWPPHLPGASQHRPGLLSTAAPLWHSPCPAAPPACAQGFELGISGLVLTFLLRDEGPRLLIGHSLRARGCVCLLLVSLPSPSCLLPSWTSLWKSRQCLSPTWSLAGSLSGTICPVSTRCQDPCLLCLCGH